VYANWCAKVMTNKRLRKNGCPCKLIKADNCKRVDIQIYNSDYANYGEG